MRSVRGTLLQLVPLGLLAGYLVLLSRPIDDPSGMPGVAFSRPPGLWYAFPLSVALAGFGAVAVASEIAANAAAILTLAAIFYGLRLWLPGDDPADGSLVLGLAAFSLVGFAIRWRAWGREVARD
jgi:hypothetical protein